MYQGETLKTIMSGFPCNVEDVTQLMVVFKQNGQTVLEKSLYSCQIDTVNQTITLQLTEKESLNLQPGIVERSVVFKVGRDRYEAKPDKIIVIKTTVSGSLQI